MVRRVWINSKPDMQMIVSLPGYDAGPDLADEYKSLDSNWSPLRIVQRVEGRWKLSAGGNNLWYANITNFFTGPNRPYLIYIRGNNGIVENLYGAANNEYNAWNSHDYFRGNPGVPIIGVVFEMSS